MIKIDNDDNEQCRQIAGNFDHHVDVVIRCGTHCPLEHTPSFTRSHWMPLLLVGECEHQIALVATMILILVENTEH